MTPRIQTPSDGTLAVNRRQWCWGELDSGTGSGESMSMPHPTAIGGLESVVGVAVGPFAACAWSATGTSWCWGSISSDRGRWSPSPVEVIGVVSTTSVSVSEMGACALAASEAVCWGNNYLGQLSDPYDGGSNEWIPPTSFGPASQVSAGDDLTCFVDSSGTVNCQGGRRGNSRHPELTDLISCGPIHWQSFLLPFKLKADFDVHLRGRVGDIPG